jgi:hypothetical protein
MTPTPMAAPAVKVVAKTTGKCPKRQLVNGCGQARAPIAIETLHKKVQSFSIAERDSNYVFTSLMTPTPMAAPAVKVKNN